METKIDDLDPHKLDCPVRGFRVLHPGDQEAWTFSTGRWQANSRLLVGTWADRNVVIVTKVYAVNKGRRHFSELRQRIELDGYEVIVESPLNEMRPILQRWGSREQNHFCGDDLEDLTCGWWRVNRRA